MDSFFPKSHKIGAEAMRIAARTRAAPLNMPPRRIAAAAAGGMDVPLLVNAGKYRHNPGKEDEQDNNQHKNHHRRVGNGFSEVLSKIIFLFIVNGQPFHCGIQQAGRSPSMDMLTTYAGKQPASRTPDETAVPCGLCRTVP